MPPQASFDELINSNANLAPEFKQQLIDQLKGKIRPPGEDTGAKVREAVRETIALREK